jgi:hypothetical protein
VLVDVVVHVLVDVVGFFIIYPDLYPFTPLIAAGSCRIKEPHISEEMTWNVVNSLQ